jgi:hypothetical protein
MLKNDNWDQKCNCEHSRSTASICEADALAEGVLLWRAHVHVHTNPPPPAPALLSGVASRSAHQSGAGARSTHEVRIPVDYDAS